jgi:hypothetical protein
VFLKGGTACHKRAHQSNHENQESEIFKPSRVRKRLIAKKSLSEPKKSPGEKIVKLENERDQRKNE